ncbi:MAG: hypothetical protein ACTH72_10390, partial [Glutamicibacter ardleyensis]
RVDTGTFCGTFGGANAGTFGRVDTGTFCGTFGGANAGTFGRVDTGTFCGTFGRANAGTYGGVDTGTFRRADSGADGFGRKPISRELRRLDEKTVRRTFSSLRIHRGTHRIVA